MNLEAEASSIERAMRASRRNLKNLIRFFDPSQGKKRSLVIRKVRELYTYRSLSQFTFDLLMRTFLNVGNWAYSVGLGIHRGYWIFQLSRDKFRDAMKYRPPIHISEAQARRDLEKLLAEGKVRME